MKPTFRCSSLDRDLNCNGAIVLVPLVAPREGDEGAEGTGLHHSGHSRIIKELGATGEIGPKPVANLSFSHWIADYYFNHVRETVPAEWSLECEAALSYEFFLKEPRHVTDVEWVDGAPVVSRELADGFVLSGHIDCVALSPDATEAIGWDLKTGYDPVDVAESNWQILGYCVLLRRAYPSLAKVTFYIVQPRNNEDEGDQRVSSVTIENLDAAVETLAARIEAAMANSMEVNSGHTQCRWCPVGCQCPALQADLEIMKITMTAEAVALIKRTPDPETLAEWVIGARTLTQPTKDATELLHKVLDATAVVTSRSGVVVTRKIQKGSYDVPDRAKFHAALKAVLPSEDSFVKTHDPSMTKIKEEIAAVMNVPKTSKAGISAEGIFDAQLRPLVVQGERRLLQFT